MLQSMGRENHMPTGMIAFRPGQLAAAFSMSYNGLLMAASWYASHEGLQYWIQYNAATETYELTADTTHELVGGGFCVTLGAESPAWVWDTVEKVFGAEKTAQIRCETGKKPGASEDSWPSDEWKDWNTM